VPPLTISSRFNGPPESGNGGYVCGAFAVALEAAVRVRLLAPPPLEVPLDVAAEPSAGAFTLRDGTRVIATAVADRLTLEVPAPPPYVQAVDASRHYAGFCDHPFPGCFVCGPHRRRGDGLRIFPGRLETGIVAAPWLPGDALGSTDGKVPVEFHWAALDCPGYFAIASGRQPMLLGEMQAQVDRLVRIDETCTIIGWKIGSEGRRHYAGTAIFDGNGELCARARATWVDLKSAG
jgi:hypothetical protein